MTFRLPALALSALLGVTFLAAPAVSDEDAETERLNALVLERFLEGQARVMRVSDPIRLAGAPYCGDSLVSVIGVYAANRATFENILPQDIPYEKALNASAVDRFGLDKRPRILLVVPGLPADRGGVEVGDIVTHVDGRKVNRYVQMDSLRRKGAEGPIRLTVERDGVVHELQLDDEAGCAEPSRFMFGTEVNAFATHYGKNTGIYMFGGMLEFFESDDDVAVIMGHELAHMILKHTQTAATQKTEGNADYLGLYLAARAGFGVSESIEVWEELGRTNPYSTIDWGHYSHPISPRRAIMLRETVEEIAGKQQRGEPLDPRGGL